MDLIKKLNKICNQISRREEKRREEKKKKKKKNFFHDLDTFFHQLPTMAFDHIKLPIYDTFPPSVSQRD
jgi:hypothetical protein